MRKYLFSLCGLLVGFLLCCPYGVLAHAFDYGAITTVLRAKENRISLRTEVPQHIDIDVTDINAQLEIINGYYIQDFSVRQAGSDCPFALSAFDTTSIATTTSFVGAFTCPLPVTGINDISMSVSVFADFFLTFDHFITLYAGEKQWDLVFNKDKQEYPKDVNAVEQANKTLAANSSVETATVSIGSMPAAAFESIRSFISRFLVVARNFLQLGILHIVLGYDHILFLLSIILLIRSIRKIVLLVTSFTIAHSITLILAGLHVVSVSPRIVEPMIALSIAYVAIRNSIALWTHKEGSGMHERWATTFAFGLVHGLGFAGALTQSGIPQIFFVPALVIFNVGIEIGQFGILCIVVPMLFATDRRPWQRIALSIVSAIISALSILWFLQRM